MSRSRAEYLRAYRAARREQRQDHVCECCGRSFTPKRTDARFCSAACRAAYWRPIRHHAVQHNPDGFPLEPHQANYPGVQPCVHQTGERSFCWRPSAWRHQSILNRERGHVSQAFYCDEHIWLHAPEDEVVVGEELHDAVVRHGREDRARHGSAAGIAPIL